MEWRQGGTGIITAATGNCISSLFGEGGRHKYWRGRGGAGAVFLSPEIGVDAESSGVMTAAVRLQLLAAARTQLGARGFCCVRNC